LIIVVGGVALGVVIRSLHGYAAEKGKNLATKEDIAVITNQVESIRATYAERLQTLVHENSILRDQAQRHHQLSLAAIDKRLEAHQGAFAIWRQILFRAHEKNSTTFFQDGEKWF
jgi:hypothetical protein